SPAAVGQSNHCWCSMLFGGFPGSARSRIRPPGHLRRGGAVHEDPLPRITTPRTSASSSSRRGRRTAGDKWALSLPGRETNMSSHWTHRTMVNCTTTLLVAAGLLVACDRQTEPSASADPSARMQFDVATLGTADDPTLPSPSAVLQRDAYDLTDELA